MNLNDYLSPTAQLTAISVLFWALSIYSICISCLIWSLIWTERHYREWREPWTQLFLGLLMQLGAAPFHVGSWNCIQWVIS